MADFRPKKKYLLTYFLGTRTAIDWNEIHRFAKKNHLEVVYIASQGQIDKFDHTNASVEEWLSLVAHAEYVVTNSFHGTVFSLLFGKRFLTYPITGPNARMNDRITTLLSPLRLENRVYRGKIDAIKDGIHYNQVHDWMNFSLERTQAFLKEWGL
jgi:hypothetical protein